MVRRGEYLERAVVFEGDAGAVEGLYHRGTKRPPLLILPHELMESPIVAEVAYQVTRAGHATLRMNYRGLGASAGTFDGIGGALSDANRARDHLALSAGASQLAVLGVGFGAEVAGRLVESAGVPIERLLLVSPVVAKLPGAVPAETVVVFSEEEARASKPAADAWADDRPGVRIAVIPGADRRFLRGLSELGRVVREAIAPPGLLTLD